MKQHPSPQTLQVVIKQRDSARYLAAAHQGTGIAWVPDPKHAKKFPSRYAAKTYRNRTDLPFDTEIVPLDVALTPSN